MTIYIISLFSHQFYRFTVFPEKSQNNSPTTCNNKLTIIYD